MILQQIDLKVKVTWLDNENVNKEGRRVAMAERLRNLFEEDFRRTAKERYDLRMELVEAR